jgi:hypothetical protein
MTDVARLLARQAAWQKRRTLLTWPEKVRMAERVRDSLAQLRRQPRPLTVPPKS